MEKAINHARYARKREKNKTLEKNRRKVSDVYDKKIEKVMRNIRKNPKKYKSAKLIKEINWKDFEKMALSIKFKPGQHFILDQKAAKIIRKKKIPTYILGQNLKHLENVLKGKKFEGTLIRG